MPFVPARCTAVPLVPLAQDSSPAQLSCMSIPQTLMEELGKACAKPACV